LTEKAYKNCNFKYKYKYKYKFNSANSINSITKANQTSIKNSNKYTEAATEPSTGEGTKHCTLAEEVTYYQIDCVKDS